MKNILIKLKHGDGVAARPGFYNAIGTLFPVAPGDEPLFNIDANPPALPGGCLFGATAAMSLCGNTPPHFLKAAIAAQDLPFLFRPVHDKIRFLTGLLDPQAAKATVEKEKA